MKIQNKSNKNHKQVHKTEVRAKKNLGQHFLTDNGIIYQIVDSISPKENENLLEIGPGLGAITIDVLKRCKHLTAIELDRRVIPVLAQKSKDIGNLDIIEEDVLEVDFNKVFPNQNYRVFGNLPYNISTPVLFKLVAYPQIRQMIFMLQKEVIDRMIADVGDKAYGRLSIMLAQTHDIYYLFDVPPSSFTPPPQVMSAMVELITLDEPRWKVDNQQVFYNVVKQAFSMRRKTIRNNLKDIIEASDLINLDIDAGLRAEQISGAEFAKIANFIARSSNG